MIGWLRRKIEEKRAEALARCLEEYRRRMRLRALEDDLTRIARDFDGVMARMGRLQRESDRRAEEDARLRRLFGEEGD